MPTTLTSLRIQILSAAVLGSALSGCCTTKVVTAEECLSLEPGELECPSFDQAEEELDLAKVIEVTVYPERTYRVGGRTYVAPVECCYTHEETVTDCGSSHGFGRPLIVDGKSVRASLAARAGWSTRPGAAGGARNGPGAEARARAWRERGLLEHAAVASFSCFTLELLALGAPASLVRAAQRAALEETAHAELCFSRAAAYDGRDLGPGPLDVAGALGAPSAALLAERLVREGCVDETLGVVELLDLAEREDDPEDRRALERLARDEIRHAALGFAALAWLAASDETGASRLAAAAGLRRARAEMAAAGGRTSAVWDEVVGPIAATVLS